MTLKYAKGSNGGVSGVIDNTAAGTPAAMFMAKITNWAARFGGELMDVSGYGDVDANGKPYTVYDLDEVTEGVGSAAGFLLSETDAAVSAPPGVANLQGTTDFANYNGMGELTLTADTGKTYTGQAIVFNIRIDSQFKGKRPTVAFQFAFTGPIAEGWA